MPALLSAQDSLFKYRVTTFHVSVSHFILAAPQYPQTTSFFPSASLSLKSADADSLYNFLDRKNFMITLGIANSRFLFSDDLYFKNFLNKSPMLVFSKRFWGGFGINYRKEISKKLILDLDIAPIVQIIIDKSVETRTDTASWESRGYEDIYEGLHVYANAKLEFRSNDNYAFYFTVSASVPLLNRFVDNGDDKYRDQFKGQLFAGVGLRYFYKSKRKVEVVNRPR
ncbi:MAG: hypothetical protein ACXVPN_08055 [Bacteroidia bacterium]